MVSTMKDIHDYLDGSHSGADLAPGDRARADELRALLDRAAAHVRSTPAPDLAARVMDALPERAPSRGWRAVTDWLWNPRPVRWTFRPAYALAGGLCALAAAIAIPTLDGDRTPARVAIAPVTATAAQPVVYVQFRLETRARQVAIAGTFTGWQPTVPLQESEAGVWTALVPLKPGVHDYVFVVDGTEWVPDPHAPQQVDDDFGGTNSRISLPPLGSA
jgi:hypothetical protein